MVSTALCVVEVQSLIRRRIIDFLEATISIIDDALIADRDVRKLPVVRKIVLGIELSIIGMASKIDSRQFP